MTSSLDLPQDPTVGTTPSPVQAPARIRIRTEQPPAQPNQAAVAAPRESIFRVNRCSISYGPKTAVRDVTMNIDRNRITALIGPSGCGKTTFLRSLNRMHD